MQHNIFSRIELIIRKRLTDGRPGSMLVERLRKEEVKFSLVAFRDLHNPADDIRLDIIVGIDKHHIFATCSIHTRIAGRTHALVLLLDNLNILILLGEFRT